MKAIILSAGMGTRLDKYTKDMPKGLLDVRGKSLIERQIEILRRFVEKIIIVRGYHAEKISFPGITCYDNQLYHSTNMVESLMCAKEELKGDLIVSYGDILFEERILREVLNSQADIGVTVDVRWQEYWKSRYGNISTDTESLRIDYDQHIREIGKPDPIPEEIDGRYVGLLKFSHEGTGIMKQVYDRAKALYAGKRWRNSRSFEQGYMTDLIQEIIDAGVPVKAIIVEHGWLEFDTNEDYEKVLLWADNGHLSKFCRLED